MYAHVVLEHIIFWRVCYWRWMTMMAKRQYSTSINNNKLWAIAALWSTHTHTNNRIERVGVAAQFILILFISIAMVSISPLQATHITFRLCRSTTAVQYMRRALRWGGVSPGRESKQHSVGHHRLAHFYSFIIWQRWIRAQLMLLIKHWTHVHFSPYHHSFRANLVQANNHVAVRLVTSNSLNMEIYWWFIIIFCCLIELLIFAGTNNEWLNDRDARIYMRISFNVAWKWSVGNSNGSIQLHCCGICCD